MKFPSSLIVNLIVSFVMYHTILLNAKKENEIMMLGKFTYNISAKRNYYDSVKELQGSV